MANEHQVPIEELSAYFQGMAKQFYTQNGPDGETFIPAPTHSNEDPSRLRNLHEYLVLPSDFSDAGDENSQQLQTLSYDELVEVEDILGDHGFHNFTYFANGSSAQCFRSGNVALRIGPAPSSDVPNNKEMAMVRERCPLVLQPELTILTEHSRVLFEISPFILNIRNSRIPEAFSDVIEDVFEGTCFEPYDDDKDLGLLPDGTPIYLDPDAVYLKNRLIEPTQKDFDLIRENSLRAGWPEAMAWVTPDGRFKQEQFYPMKQSKAPSFVVR